jgi:hypothetical protein
VSKGAVSSDESPIRLRQHGTFYSFSQKNSQREFFCEKDLVFSALPEAISPVKTWDRLLHASIGRFAFFVHFAAFVVQTFTA